MTEGKRNVIQGLLREYGIQTAENIQDALKDLLSGTLKEMLEAEMDGRLGYDLVRTFRRARLPQRDKAQARLQQIWRV